jgi:acetoin utilization deacetylase AcuC-like enzyme
MSTITRRVFCTSLSAACTSGLLHHLYARGTDISTVTGTGYVHHPDFSLFENNTAEHFQRTHWIDTRLEESGVAQDTLKAAPFDTPMEVINELHTSKHIDMIDAYGATGGFSLTIGQAARMAVGHILGAVDEVCSGRMRNAFCSIRPPGHHVLNSGEIGFCCFANVVLAARFARQKHGIGRILIVDWDYHQGNGTHSHLCGDDKTLFFETFNPEMYSTKCDDFHPVVKGGEVPDDSLRINVQMPVGSTNDDFIHTYEDILIPAAERFQPELVLVSCGFDCKQNDGLGRFQVTANGISRLTRIVRQIADTFSEGKLVSILEGGYADSPRDKTIQGTDYTFSGLAQCSENHVKTLLTGNEQPETPYFSSASTMSLYQSVQHPSIRWRNGILSGLPVARQPFKMTITDVTGHRLFILRKINESWIKPDLRKLAKGTYNLTIHDRDGKALHVEKIFHVTSQR